MIIEGRVVRIRGDNIDTDVLYPGPFLNLEDLELMKNHLFEGLDPLLRNRLHGDTALVVDSNFGSGSIAHLVELHLAPEDPVDAHCVGQNDGHADSGHGQHDAQRLGRGSGIVDVQTVGRIRVAQHQVREHLQAEEPHQ